MEQEKVSNFCSILAENVSLLNLSDDHEPLSYLLALRLESDVLTMLRNAFDSVMSKTPLNPSNFVPAVIITTRPYAKDANGFTGSNANVKFNAMALGRLPDRQREKYDTIVTGSKEKPVLVYASIMNPSGKKTNFYYWY